MSISIGLDIGGTKIAGAAFDNQGNELAREVVPVPQEYSDFISTCCAVVARLESLVGHADHIGVGIPGVYDRRSGCVDRVANIPCILAKPLRPDLCDALGRQIGVENDANCMALAEAMEGAGRGHAAVFGLIMGTGVGGGFVYNGSIWAGANSLCGEVGHMPMPFYEPEDGELLRCHCGQVGCVEKMISGSALAGLYKRMTGEDHDAKKIAYLASTGDQEATAVLDRYFTVVAKAMVIILHAFDPDIITVSGGLNSLPGLYEAIPQRWGKYALYPNISTKFVPAEFGAMAGLRGAAWAGIAANKSNHR